MSRITDLRRELRAAVEPLLREGERVSVAAAPSEYAKGLAKLHFAVTVTVGPAGEEAVAERLDELLSGSLTAALEGCESRPLVTKTSGYQQFPEVLLGATWTAEIVT